MKNEIPKPLQGNTPKTNVRNNIIVATMLFIILAGLFFSPITVITEPENLQYWKEIKLGYIISLCWGYIMFVVIRLLTYHANNRKRKKIHDMLSLFKIFVNNTYERTGLSEIYKIERNEITFEYFKKTNIKIYEFSDEYMLEIFDDFVRGGFFSKSVHERDGIKNNHEYQLWL